jgi:hypothetical protein
MAFLEWLVNIDVFDSIEVGFLMVGHTHENIDQRFSVLSRYLKNKEALTPSAFRCAIRDAYRARPGQDIIDALEEDQLGRREHYSHYVVAVLSFFYE